MKKYLAGVLTGALVSGIVLGTALSALAISGRMTIEIDPINVQVNGQVFSPTDANGREVPVFAYNGTTYAPLRALAEAYGLEVGYDAGSNMATVAATETKTTETPETTATLDTTAKATDSDWSAEDEAAYQEFKGMWTLIEKKEHPNGHEDIDMIYKYETNDQTFNIDDIYDNHSNFIDRFAHEISSADFLKNGVITIAFFTPNGGKTPTIFLNK